VRRSTEDLEQLLCELEAHMPVLMEFYPPDTEDFSKAFEVEVRDITTYAGPDDMPYVQQRIAGIRSACERVPAG
jgi:hypothetical protein